MDRWIVWNSFSKHFYTNQEDCNKITIKVTNPNEEEFNSLYRRGANKYKRFETQVMKIKLDKIPLNFFDQIISVGVGKWDHVKRMTQQLNNQESGNIWPISFRYNPSTQKISLKIQERCNLNTNK